MKGKSNIFVLKDGGVPYKSSRGQGYVPQRVTCGFRGTKGTGSRELSQGLEHCAESIGKMSLVSPVSTVAVICRSGSFAF